MISGGVSDARSLQVRSLHALCVITGSCLPRSFGAGNCQVPRVDDSELNLPGRKASLSPRLVSAGIDSARIVVSLGPRQDSYVAYEFTHDRDKKQICILYAGTAEKVNWSILLPNGARDVSVKCSGKPVETKTMGIENSSYITFETSGPGAFDSVVGEVVVSYSAGV